MKYLKTGHFSGGPRALLPLNASLLWRFHFHRHAFDGAICVINSFAISDPLTSQKVMDPWGQRSERALCLFALAPTPVRF